MCYQLLVWIALHAEVMPHISVDKIDFGQLNTCRARKTDTSENNIF